MKPSASLERMLSGESQSKSVNFDPVNVQRLCGMSKIPVFPRASHRFLSPISAIQMCFPYITKIGAFT